MPRLKPTDRKAQILEAAVQLSAAQGYSHVTREGIATAAECAPGLVSNYFGTMTNLRRDIMRAAIRQRNLTIIAQGLAAKDAHACKAPDELKKAALETLAA
jgi:AcrR family transcriptional regulator